MRNLPVWKLIADSFERKLPVILLYVLESKGSSPGRQGFAMAVNAAGEMMGSIGGGIMEHKWVEFAKEQARSLSSLQTLKKQKHDKTGMDQSGMICSGEQTILVYPLRSSDPATVQSLIASMEAGKSGELRISPAGLQFIEDECSCNFSFELQSEVDWIYREKTGPHHSLSIIGGGHCALALSKLMSDHDFFIRVYDTRPRLSTMQQNIYADQLIELEDYSQLRSHLPVVDLHYVVIMTFGYRTDDEVVRALQGRNFQYLGLLGSANKISTMMEQYRTEGFDENWLRSLHAPIGMQISSRTPAEIAVSIAAQIISVKNKHK